MTDELRLAVQSAKQVLLRLQTISDAPSAAPASDAATTAEGTRPSRLRTRGTEALPRARQPHGKSKVPDGVDMRSGDHAPSRRLSLYAHYLWRMRRAIKAEDMAELYFLTASASRDYLEYIGKYVSPHDEFHDDSVERLIAEWEGWSAAEVAAWLHAPEAWVRRQRTLAERDPETGEPTEQDPLLARIVKMQHAGKSTRAIGKELGISHMRVQRLLRGE